MPEIHTKHLHGLRPRDFPSESHQLFDVMRGTLQVNPGATKAQYLAAVSSLTEMEVETLVVALVEIFDQVARYQPIGEAPPSP